MNMSVLNLLTFNENIGWKSVCHTVDKQGQDCKYLINWFYQQSVNIVTNRLINNYYLSNLLIIKYLNTILTFKQL